MATRLGLILALGLSAQAAPHAAPQDQVQERVTVERIILRGDVVDRFARPIPGLGMSDFRLRVDGQETPIESVDWYPGRPPRKPTAAPTAGKGVRASPATAAPARPDQAAAPSPETEAAPREQEPEPQLYVLLFQWEIAAQKDVGFMRMVRQALQFSDSRSPQDRIAVLGFGSSLRVLQDFTRDRAAVRRGILDVRSASHSGTADADAGATMAEYATACGRADSIEQAFICIGNALRPIPGPKTLLFFGWTLQTHRFSLRENYPSMLQAIESAHTTVYALDVSDGSHALAAGLKRLAVDTGGTYQETFDFPDLARRRVEVTVDGGYYEIVFRNPSTQRGWHGVQVELTAASEATTSGRGQPNFPRWFQN